MAKKQESVQEEPKFELPAHLAVSQADFENTNTGEVYGGTSEILMLEPDEIAGPLTYLGSRQVNLGLGPVASHEGRDAEGTTWRLPIAANFSRQIDAAGVQPGDTIWFKRLEDQTKKNGAGKGGLMQMFQLKVSKRPVGATPV